MKTKIYVLTDPKGKIRYVGKTIKTLEYRLSKHLDVAKRGIRGHRCNWLRLLLAQGQLPTIRILAEVDGNGSKEEISWIAYFRLIGVELVNETLGGEGTPGRRCSKRTRRKMSLAKKGQTPSDETRRKMSLAQKMRPPRSAASMRGLGRKGTHHSPESLSKMSKAHKGCIISAETREKISKANKGHPGWWQGKHHSIESRRKMSEARREQKRGPLSKEHRKKISEAQKARWKLRKLSERSKA